MLLATRQKIKDVPPLPMSLVAMLALGVLTAYTAVLLVARSEALWVTLLGALANTIPVVLLGLAVRSLILRHILGGSKEWILTGHTVLGLSFTALTYWSLLVLLGVINGVSATEFDVRPFDPRAMAWQSLQNLTTYGLIAALTHLQARPTVPDATSADDHGEVSDGLGRYFVRIGDEIHPLNLSEVISIVGADDYSEVRTLAGRHLVRMTLTAFESALDIAKFARVHRSSIVNLDRIDRAEPAGNGRILLHMEDGELIQTSRAGARLVRGRLI